jgi:RNA polymerase sigma-70 factor (ECF subfamily)
VAANAALMALRAQRRRPAVSFEDLPPGTLDQNIDLAAKDVGFFQSNWSWRPDDHFQTEELRGRIQAAVDALPEDQRSVFLLRDVDGMSTEDAAAILEVTIPTVKNRLHRARLTLRAAIGAYFDRP